MKKIYKILIILFLFTIGILVLYKVQKFRATELPMNKISQMLGKDAMVETINVRGAYVSNNSGGVTYSDICKITDKNKIQAIINEIEKYNLQKLSTNNVESAKNINKIGQLQSLTLSFKITKSKYTNISLWLDCNISSNIIRVNVKRSKRLNYNEAYMREVQNKDLYNFIVNTVSTETSK